MARPKKIVTAEKARARVRIEIVADVTLDGRILAAIPPKDGPYVLETWGRFVKLLVAECYRCADVATTPLLTKPAPGGES